MKPTRGRKPGESSASQILAGKIAKRVTKKDKIKGNSTYMQLAQTEIQVQRNREEFGYDLSATDFNIEGTATMDVDENDSSDDQKFSNIVKALKVNSTTDMNEVCGKI